MLFDPKWDVYSIEALIAWLEVQPPETTYDYESLTDCLVARYLIAVGHSWYDYAKVGTNSDRISIAACGRTGGHSTYGEALARAREWQKETYMAP